MSIRFFALIACAGSIGSSAAAELLNSPRIPITFVENRGQATSSVRYIGVGPDFKAWFEDCGVVLRHGQAAISILFEGAARVRTEIAAAESLPTQHDCSREATGISVTANHPNGATANYLYGSDPRQWKTNLPLFDSIHYTGVWPGVDLTYEVTGDRLKAEYIVAPGAAVDGISLRFNRDPQIGADGMLRVHDSAGDFVEDKPFVYQWIGGERREVAGGFYKRSDGSIGFRVAEYDRAKALVIDPSILFSGYFGGSSEDGITAVKIDSLQNVVVAGWSSSSDLPVSNGASMTFGGSVDAFVASFQPNGGSLIYCTFLGGSSDDRAFGLAIDSSRNVYITGQTSSINFPLVGAFQNHLGGARDAFVTKINAAGNALIYSTYLGGSGTDVGNAIVVNAAGSAVVVGDTTSSNLPVTSGVFQPKLAGAQDAFVAMLSAAGNSLNFLTYLGGRSVDHASSVYVGPYGAIFIGGYTWSNNFPTVRAYQLASGGGQDGFVTRMHPDGSALFFSTYLGGSAGSAGAPEEVNAVYLNTPTTLLTVAGTTSSANFPVTAGSLQPTFGGQTDGFVAVFAVNGSLLQSTFLGGALTDGINALTLDFHGNPYVAGYTDSQDFPVQRPLQNANAGSMDAFVVKLNTTLSTAMYGTYLGGSGSDGANAIAVDNETSVIVAGQTSSPDYPVAGSLPNSIPSTLSSFITKIAPNFTVGVAYGYQGQMEFTADPWHVSSYVSSTNYGNATDVPIVGDWTGTGVKRIGVFRNGTWILDTNGNGVLDAGDKTVLFGQTGDLPVVGDWRGTGQIALGLFRQGTFILDLSGHLSGVPTGLSDATFAFGQGGDIPVASDWNGSGTTKVGVFRNGLWLVDYNGDRVFNSLDQSYIYGAAGDLPVLGDWDSSGNPPKIGIYRNGLWVLDYDGDHTWTVPGLNEMVVTFGFAGYTPVVF